MITHMVKYLNFFKIPNLVKRSYQHFLAIDYFKT